MPQAAKLKRALLLLLYAAVILLFTGCADEQADDKEYRQEGQLPGAPYRSA